MIRALRPPFTALGIILFSQLPTASPAPDRPAAAHAAVSADCGAVRDALRGVPKCLLPRGQWLCPAEASVAERHGGRSLQRGRRVGGPPERRPAQARSDMRLPPAPPVPRRESTMRATHPPAAGPVNPDGPPQRLLVAEDLEDARTTLQQLLHLSLGLEVDTAEDGARALQMLQERPYSILVTDLRMPKLSG